MNKTRLGLLCVALLLLFASISTVTAQESIPTVSVVATADGLTVPETLPTGLVTVAFENTAEAPFIGLLLRLNDGVAMDDFMTAMGNDMMAGIALVSLKGGPAVMPGETVVMTFRLEPGDYVVLNVAAEVPQMATLVVDDGDAPDLAEPEADVVVQMVDFGYGLPLTIAPGKQLWRIDNIGEQWHEVAIASIQPGTTLDDIRALLANGDDSLQQFPILMPMDGGETIWVEVDLMPGTYSIICNLPDVMEGSEGHLHHELGMLQIITVTETVTYEDPDDLFTLDYPMELLTFPDLFAEVMPFPNLPMADSQETADLSFASEPLPDGGWGMAVIFLPKAMFAEMGLPEDASILDIADAYIASQFGSDEAADLDLGTPPPAEAITLDDGTEAAQIDLTGIVPTEDNLVVIYEISDGVVVLASLLTATDGRTDDLTAKWWATVNSITFNGTVEDLLPTE